MAESQLPATFKNTLLAQFARRNADGFLNRLSPVDLPIRKVIFEPNQEIQYAYFVELGMISIVSVMEDGRSIEIGTIGSEGVAGGILLLGATSIPYRCFVQIAGHGYRIEARDLTAWAEQNTDTRDLILRYQAVF